MKKSVKILLSIALIAVMCLSLCGCQELDDMRAMHAVWTNEGSRDSITLNGNEYIKAQGKNIYNLLYKSIECSNIYVTKKDVPVLLSSSKGETFIITDTKEIIFGNSSAAPEVSYSVSVPTDIFFTESYSYVSSEEDTIYVRKDIYNKIKDKLNSDVEYTTYGYSYYYFDEEKQTEVGKYFYMTDEQTKLINDILKNVEPEYDSGMTFGSAYIATVNKISSDHLFGDYAFDLYYDIDSDSYYLELLNDISSEYTYSLYKVPREHTNTFRVITKDAMFYFNTYDTEYYY